MDNLPKRDNPIYTDIEKFEDYELTNCIAYEMAIRNDENIQAITNFIKKHIQTNKEKTRSELICEIDLSCKYLEQLRQSFINPESLYLQYPWFNTLLSYIEQEKVNFIEVYKSKVKKIIPNELPLDNQKETYKIYTENINTRFIDALFFTKKEMDSGVLKLSDVTGEHIENSEIYLKELKTNYFIYDTSYKIENDLHEILKRDIKAYYKRPRLETYFFQNKKVKLELNLALPLKDLEATIKKLKKEFDKNHSIVLSASEFTGKQLVSLDKDIERVLSYPHNVANLFFVYDCLKVGATQNQISRLIYNYYADKDENTKRVGDPGTVKKYKEIAIDYIENKRYKELITGIKLEYLH